MGTRTVYYESVPGEGELKLLRGALTDDPKQGITSVDVRKADEAARTKIDQFLVKLGGRTKGAAVIAEFRDDTNTVDPIFRRLAELIAADTLLATWEEFNFGGERASDADTARGQLEAKRVRGEAMALVKELISTRASVRDDGTVRSLAFRAGTQGPIVVGPGSKGSYFDFDYYTDMLGIKYTARQRDPFKR